MRGPVLLVLLGSLPLAAQAPVPVGDRLHPDKQRVVDEVTRKRDDMRGGRVDRYNVRVRVKLKNGAKLSGVVKNGRLVERAEGIDFVEADRSTPEAGIRLHYFDETTSFVFLRWSEIDSHKVVVKMSDDEVRALERELMERERKRQEERQQAAVKPPGPPAGPGSGGPDDGADPKRPTKDAKEGSKDGKADGAGKDAPAKDDTPLLTEFPPEAGWSEAKAQDIERRKVTVGVYPNEKEKRFLEVLGEWKKQQAQAEAKRQGPPAPGQTGSTGK
jgi:hypothetical protein